MNFRKRIIESILATDMGKHADKVRYIKDVADLKRDGSQLAKINNPENENVLF